MDAKATMGIYRLHKSVWEKGSKKVSKTRDPEPTDLWDLDGELNTTFKRRKLVKQLGIGTQTEGHSSVCLFPRSHHTRTIYNDCFYKSK